MAIKSKGVSPSFFLLFPSILSRDIYQFVRSLDDINHRYPPRVANLRRGRTPLPIFFYSHILSFFFFFFVIVTNEQIQQTRNVVVVDRELDSFLSFSATSSFGRSAFFKMIHREARVTSVRVVISRSRR